MNYEEIKIISYFLGSSTVSFYSSLLSPPISLLSFFITHPQGYLIHLYRTPHG